MMYISQIIMLYTLNSHSAICQCCCYVASVYDISTQKKKKKIPKKNHWKHQQQKVLIPSP